MPDGRAVQYEIVINGPNVTTGVRPSDLADYLLPDSQKRLIRSIEIIDRENGTSTCNIRTAMGTQYGPAIGTLYSTGNSIQVFIEKANEYWEVFDGEIIGVEVDYPEGDAARLDVACVDASHYLKADLTRGTLAEGSLSKRLGRLLTLVGGVTSLVVPDRSGTDIPSLADLVPSDGKTIDWGFEDSRYKTPWDILVDLGRALKANRLFVDGRTVFVVDDQFIQQAQQHMFHFWIGSQSIATADNARIATKILSLRFSTDTFRKPSEVIVPGFSIDTSGDDGTRSGYGRYFIHDSRIIFVRDGEMPPSGAKPYVIGPTLPKESGTVTGPPERIEGGGVERWREAWRKVNYKWEKQISERADELFGGVVRGTGRAVATAFGYAVEFITPAVEYIQDKTTPVGPVIIPKALAEFLGELTDIEPNVNPWRPHWKWVNGKSWFTESQAARQSVAESFLQEGLNQLTIGKLSMRGEPRVSLFSRHQITVNKAPHAAAVYNGEYIVSEVRHVIDDGGFKTHLKVMAPVVIEDSRKPQEGQ